MVAGGFSGKLLRCYAAMVRILVALLLSPSLALALPNGELRWGADSQGGAPYVFFEGLRGLAQERVEVISR